MKDTPIHIEQLMMEALLGTIDDEDASYLNGLLEHDSEVRRLWEKMKAIFEKENTFLYLKGLNEAEAWTHLKSRLGKRRSKRVALRMTIAASLMIPALIAGIFYWKSNPPLTQKDPGENKSVQLYIEGSAPVNLSKSGTAVTSVINDVQLKIKNGSLSYIPLKGGRTALNTLVIPEAITYQLTLSDGTEVMLNATSRIKFPFVFSAATREVWIEGEAYFKVSKDARHPFIVHTPSTEITVLGTEFNVNTYDRHSIKTALVSGSVKTKSMDGQDSVRLRPGYEAVFVDGKKFEVASFDKNYELSWMKGVYYFQNTSLIQIANMIRRCYGDSIVFDDSQIMSSHFTGAMIKDKPLKEFLDNLALTSDIRYSYKEGLIHLRLEK